MEQKYTTKKIIIIVLIMVILGAITFSFYPKKDSVILPINNIVEEPAITINEEPQIYKLCYSKSDLNTSGFYDKAWLKLNIQGEKISGEFYNLPAEKDSKVGSFEGIVGPLVEEIMKGTIGPLVEEIMNRKALVWWDSFAEGMRVKEELVIEFGDRSATVGFGEMVDSQLGDGVYLYKDKTNLNYIKPMSQMNCETLDEKLFAEKYIRDNIKTIATNKPVLGGSWYTTTVFINPSGKNGEVTYEDGHIQSRASFIYTYISKPENITITEFKIIK
ncbi:MAG: hypothetical protein JJE53_01665 [Candidatus Pacebacteria bacterium]|nr:hypothetical protein [Candidatus Paceibacterota bacterium]